MSKLKTRYYRLFCMVLALMILDRKTKSKSTNEKISKLLGSCNDL